MNGLLIAIITIVTTFGLIIVIWLTPVTALLLLQHKKEQKKSLSPPLTAVEENKQYEDIKAISTNIKAETDNGFKEIMRNINTMSHNYQEKIDTINQFTKKQNEDLIRLSSDISNNKDMASSNWARLKTFTDAQNSELLKLVTNFDSTEKNRSEKWKSLESFTRLQREKIIELVSRAKEHTDIAVTSKDELRKIVGFQNQFQQQITERFNVLEEIKNIFLNTNLKGQFAEKNCSNLIESIIGVNSPLLNKQKSFVVDKKIFRPDFVIKGTSRMKSIVIDAKCPTSSYREMLKDDNTFTRKKFQNAFLSVIKDVSKYVKKLSEEIAIYCIFIPSDRMFLDIMENHCVEIFDKCTNNGIFLAAPSNLIYCIQLFDAMQKDVAFSRNIEKVKKSILFIKKKYDEFFNHYDALSKQISTIYGRNLKLLQNKEKLRQSYEQIAFPVVNKSYNIVKKID